MIRILFFLSFVIAGVTVFGQQQKQLLKQEKDSITFTIGGGIDLYYGHHSSNKTDIPYYVSHAKHNQINLNLAYLNINLTYQKFRANVVPAIGTYMLANYATDHQTAQRLVLANVGYQLNKEKNIFRLSHQNYSKEFSIEKLNKNEFDLKDLETDKIIRNIRVKE